MTQTKSKTQEILEGDAEHNSGLWSPNIVFTHGDGVMIYDADGNAYIDCLAGIAVASVGHANARLAKAVSEQAQKLIVCPQNLGSDTRVRFYDKLFEFIPEWLGLTRVFMANSGSEVNEAALEVGARRDGPPALRVGQARLLGPDDGRAFDYLGEKVPRALRTSQV